MREIKFRFIFDNMEKFFYTLDQILDSSFLEEQMCEEMNSVIGTDEDFIEYKLIAKNEYTGLKDKNGVEIYEADILKVASNRHSNYISFTGSFCYVEYNEDGCRFLATTGDGYDTRNAFDLTCDVEVEVIGNIYENKDLFSV